MMDGTDLIPLEDVREKVFGITKALARRKAALGTLPIPAFRLSGTTKGPLYIRKSDLEKLIDRQAAKAEKLNYQMRMAGAV